jgi:hypothetical protein
MFAGSDGVRPEPVPVGVTYKTSQVVEPETETSVTVISTELVVAQPGADTVTV